MFPSLFETISHCAADGREKKRQKFGDVVNDVFPSQWFFHALYKKTGRRDMRPPRSDFL